MGGEKKKKRENEAHEEDKARPRQGRLLPVNLSFLFKEEDVALNCNR